MAGNVGTVLFCLCLSIELAKSSDILQNDELFTTSEHDPIKLSSDLKSPSKKADLKAKAEEALSSRNNWGFSDGLSEWPEKHGETPMSELAKTLSTVKPYYEEVDPSRNGLLKDIGSISE
ncbi:hypothetical protein Y032_0323g2494 [Ancylostoma ceylanicum]|uniref:Uncharacterized protein n=1 Tax=Ancylostoma ceylanicum TaxID=53326 RepID=A0A016S1A2_9BILA|nr:hypothetical protein Y032_0323g2494 [Ancylostoma ceylanicum]